MAPKGRNEWRELTGGSPFDLAPEGFSSNDLGADQDIQTFYLATPEPNLIFHADQALDVYLPWYWQPIMAGVRSLPERIFQRFEFLAGR